MPILDYTEKIYERLKAGFDVFFEDKYKDEATRNAIINDLMIFLAYDYIEAISFCYYDSKKEAITHGYYYELGSGYSGRPVRKDVEVINKKEITELRKGGRSEKYLALKLSSRFKELDERKREEAFRNITLQWNFMLDPEVEYTIDEDKFFEERDFQIRRGKISGSK